MLKFDESLLSKYSDNSLEVYSRLSRVEAVQLFKRSTELVTVSSISWVCLKGW